MSGIRAPGERPAELWVTRLGLTDYDEALSLQHRLRRARVAAAIPDVLLLLEHPPVYTRGRRSEAAELPRGGDWYRNRGVALRDVDRGGKTTYHGPGQLVGYPILDTIVVDRDVSRLVRSIERALIAALAGEGVAARRDAAGRGVWAGGGKTAGKIGSIGLHVSHGVTTHGFAVNVDCDLTPFSWIKPCGLDDPATSIATQTGRAGGMRCFSRRAAFELARSLGLRQRLVSRARLLAELNAAAASPVLGGTSVPPAEPPAQPVHASDDLVFSP
ncbi:MAG: lipoyl(octanoyl) transferase LipB [Solirubrobacterales bacterium]